MSSSIATSMGTLHRQPVYEGVKPPVRILLRSNDDKHLWVHQMTLISVSTFFAGLFSLPEPRPAATTQPLTSPKPETKIEEQQSTETEMSSLDSADDSATDEADLEEALESVQLDETDYDAPIDIDADFTDLLLFVQYMELCQHYQQYVNPPAMNINIDVARRLWLLIDQYDCPNMLDMLRQRLATLAIRQPWEVLHLASDMEDIAVGRVAISKLTNHHLHVTSITGAADPTMWLQLSKLCIAWQLEFVKLLMPSLKVAAGSGHNEKTQLFAFLSPDYGAISQKFNPRV